MSITKDRSARDGVAEEGRMMRAAILRAPREMVVEDRPVPQPGPGWLRVKVMASGICGSDMHIYTGEHPWLQPGNAMAKYVLGNTYGHEVAGVVDALGMGVTSRRAGDRVALNAIIPCMKCAYCRVGQYQICTDLAHYGFQQPGGFAEYLLVPEQNAVPLPDSLSFEEGALIDVLVVGIHAVQRAAVAMADRVAILGAGPIGLGIAAAAVRAGARDTFIVAQFPLQQEMARRIGVRHVLTLDDDIPGRILEATGGRGVDAVIEGVGFKSRTMETAVAIARKGARIAFTGVFEAPVTLQFGDLLAKELSIAGSHAFGMWGIVPEFELALEMIERGEFPARDLVTHRFPLERIDEAFRTKLERGSEALKVQIVD